MTGLAGEHLLRQIKIELQQQFKSNFSDRAFHDLVLYQGPLFDDMQSLWLGFELLEVDYYPRFEVWEWAFDIHERLLEFQGSVALEDGGLDLESEYARARLEVEVYDLY